MDEMTAVRELRAEAPRARRADLVTGREKLLAEAGPGGRVRRLRADWRLAAVGATAAIVVAAVVGTQVAGGSGETQPGSRPGYTIELGSAKDLLNDAADAMAAGGGVSAQDGQWIYTKTVETNLSDDERPGPRTEEHWTKYADPAMEDGKAGDDHSPREQAEFLRSLPDDPARVRAEARAFYHATDDSESRTEHEYRALTVLLSRAYVYEAEDLAKVYRALATIPGVRAANVEDAAGRDAIALYLKSDRPGQDRDETLIDPVTHLYSGVRWVSGKDEAEWKKGDAVISLALLRTAVVDQRGERP
ncbi:CU044_5270 family protein [Streptomyces sp. NPDC003635]